MPSAQKRQYLRPGSHRPRSEAAAASICRRGFLYRTTGLHGGHVYRPRAVMVSSLFSPPLNTAAPARRDIRASAAFFGILDALDSEIGQPFGFAFVGCHEIAQAENTLRQFGRERGVEIGPHARFAGGLQSLKAASIGCSSWVKKTSDTAITSALAATSSAEIVPATLSHASAQFARAMEARGSAPSLATE